MKPILALPLVGVLFLSPLAATVAAPPEAERERLSQVLDGLSEAELRALLERVQAQERQAAQTVAPIPAAAPPLDRPPGSLTRGDLLPMLNTSVMPPPPQPPVAPAVIPAPFPGPLQADPPPLAQPARQPKTAAERLEWIRLKVVIEEAAAGVLATLGPMAQKPKVQDVTKDLIGQFLRREGNFSHIPVRSGAQKPTEVRILAEKLRVAIAEAMGADAPYGLSPSARALFEDRILAVVGKEEEGLDLEEERQRLEAKLRPPPPPPPPLTPVEIERIDEIYRQQAIAERKVDNHSSQVLKRWVEEEARRRRRRLVASGEARTFLLQHR